jgi:RNase adaptor protein for sRNA GlmZ degradation
MFKRFFLFIFILFIPSIIQCDLTNLNDFLSILSENPSVTYPIGFLTKANNDIVKRYLRGNINHTIFKDKDEMLQAIDNEKIIGIKHINNLIN